MKSLITVIIPTYNGAETIQEAIMSVLYQNYQDFRILIQDDCSTDKTLDIVRTIKDTRIRIQRNEINLGCQMNFEKARQTVSTDFIFFLCQDDILDKNALKKVMKAFENPEVGAVTRPYFWFDTDIREPVRYLAPISTDSNTNVTIESDRNHILTCISSAGQLSGLAYRRSCFTTPFHPDIFPGHVYPFLDILKRRTVVFLKDYIVAVRISSSQSRKISSIYAKSPTLSWVQMYNTVLSENKYAALRKYLITEHTATIYLGLLQIKNYSTYKNVLREIGYLIKFRPQNLLNPQFWMIVILVLITPPQILIRLVDLAKRYVVSKTIPQIRFQPAGVEK